MLKWIITLHTSCPVQEAQTSIDQHQELQDSQPKKNNPRFCGRKIIWFDLWSYFSGNLQNSYTELLNYVTNSTVWYDERSSGAAVPVDGFERAPAAFSVPHPGIFPVLHFGSNS